MSLFKHAYKIYNQATRGEFIVSELTDFMWQEGYRIKETVLLNRINPDVIEAAEEYFLQLQHNQN